MNVCPFIEAEKQGSRNVKRACELLKVSRAAFMPTGPGLPGVPSRTRTWPRRVRLCTRGSPRDPGRAGRRHL